MSIIKYGNFYVHAHGNGQFSGVQRAEASSFIDQVAITVLNHIREILVKHELVIEKV